RRPFGIAGCTQPMALKERLARARAVRHVAPAEPGPHEVTATAAARNCLGSDQLCTKCPLDPASQLLRMVGVTPPPGRGAFKTGARTPDVRNTLRLFGTAILEPGGCCVNPPTMASGSRRCPVGHRSCAGGRPAVRSACHTRFRSHLD